MVVWAGKIAEDPAACSAIVREVGAIQQLILMALSENEVVVQQACKTLGTPLLALFYYQTLGRPSSLSCVWLTCQCCSGYSAAALLI